MDVICAVIGIGVVAWVVYQIGDSIAASNREQSEKIRNYKAQINSHKSNFETILHQFFQSTSGDYNATYTNLKHVLDQMQTTNNSLRDTSKNENEQYTISRLSSIASAFNNYGMKISRFDDSKMMDVSNYGKINRTYWETVRAMSKDSVSSAIFAFDRQLNSNDFTNIFEIDPDIVLKCVWFYAIQKPYSASDFQKAEKVFRRICKKSHVDITIAEFYAIKQMGSEDVLRDRVRGMLKFQHTSKELTLIASALMWMNAYQAESMVLQYMLSSGMQMTAKTQDRLHSLSNGGGKAPTGFDVFSNRDSLYFDVSALAWKDDEYTGLFENLAFQDKTLSYSLAIRDEDKDLFVTQGIKVPSMNTILAKLKSVFAEEYGSSVTATLSNCIALSGSGQEKMSGILVVSNECKQMGILVHVARIGKKLDIKFYTLFIPSGNKLAEQKQQALSLYQKLSPTVAMWESSLKDTTLMAIQQLLNATSQNGFAGGGNTSDGDGPIF